MILSEALRAVPRRVRRPLVLTLILVFTFTGVGYPLLMTWLVRHLPPPHPYVPPLTLWWAILTLLSSVNTFALSPLPWQWTGDGRRIAPPLRGMLQAFAFGLAMAVLNSVLNLETLRQTFAQLPADAPVAFKLAAFASGLLFGVIFSGLIGFVMAFWEARQAEKAEALRQSEEARWNLLKAQMSPHVLLNSLNGLAELVRDDPEAAVKGMQDLAEIYHQLLTLGAAPKVALGQERRLLERYLAVEQLRLGEQLRVEWAWDETLDALPVIPLLLQPLVENAIKHGVAADPEGGVLRIETRLEGEHLRLAVANTGRAREARTRPGGGVGLRNLKSRLELAYGGAASFQLLREDKWTRAELGLPMEAP